MKSGENVGLFVGLNVGLFVECDFKSGNAQTQPNRNIEHKISHLSWMDAKNVTNAVVLGIAPPAVLDVGSRVCVEVGCGFNAASLPG